MNWNIEIDPNIIGQIIYREDKVIGILVAYKDENDNIETTTCIATYSLYTGKREYKLMDVIRTSEYSEEYYYIKSPLAWAYLPEFKQ